MDVILRANAGSGAILASVSLRGESILLSHSDALWLTHMTLQCDGFVSPDLLLSRVIV